MAATVTIKEANGATPTWSTRTSIRFSTADVAVPGLNYPLSIPKTGFRYSYWKTLCLEVAGDFSVISNVNIFSDGNIGYTVGTGGALLIGTKDTGDSGLPIADYDQADGEEGISGYAMGDAVTGHAVYKGAGYTVKDIELYTSGAPLLVDSDEHVAAGKVKAIVLQVKCDTVVNGALPGVQTAETLVFQYDEI